MPVNVLFCEGGPKSPDIRVLNSVLAGVGCTIRPSGGKYGFGQMVRVYRQAHPGSTVAGLRDRDFDGDVVAPNRRPREWLVDGGSTWMVVKENISSGHGSK